MNRAALWVGGAVLFGAAACVDFGATAPDQVLYLSFERLPYPALVLGDTLRDSTGAVAPVRGTVIGGDGSELSASLLRYYRVGDTANILAVDTTSGVVTSTGTATGSARVVASAAGVQSLPLSVVVTLAPDTIIATLASDTVEYSFSDTTRNFSDPLAVQVLHRVNETDFEGVTGWVVHYSLEVAADTLFARLVDDQNRVMRGITSGVSHRDTTVADGSVGRKLRIQPGPPLSGGVDSVAVIAQASYRGIPVPGGPVRIWVFIRPRVGT